MLPKQQRLRAMRDFKRVYRSGRSYVHPALVLYVYRNRSQDKRIGFSVSKKMGGAVERNRVKRRLREAFRKMVGDLEPGFDAVVVSRSHAKPASFEELLAILADLFTKAGLRAEPMDIGGTSM